MIARIWHGKTKKEHADAYREYVSRTGVREYRNTDGNLGVQIWQKDDGDFTHIWTVTLWRDLESVKGFAGAEFDKAKYYPEDRNYLIEFEPKVAHYQAHVFPADAANRHWRITI
ncbi:MAG TPA: antibiotic biosynthesis monooxygenase [Bacteroidota bacterium]